MAFSQFEFGPSNRGYVQTGYHKEPERNNNGFLGISNLAGGVADLAKAAGEVGGVIDGWGAGRRKEAADNRDSLMSQAALMHPDDAANMSDEQLAGIASAYNMSPEEARAVFNMSSKQWTEDRYKQDSLRAVKESFAPEAVEDHLQATQGPPGEVPPSEVQEGQEVAPEVEGGAPEEIPAEPTVGGAVGQDLMQRQAEEMQLLTEVEAAPTTAGDWSKIVEKENTSVPKAEPNPAGLDRAGMQASRAYMDYARNQKIISAYMYNEITHGRTPNTELATEMGMRLTASEEAFTTGLKSFMLEHFDYVAKDWEPFINDPTYFEDAISYTRYNYDSEYRDEMLSKNPDEVARLREKLSQIPHPIKKIMAGGVEKAAQAQMEMKLKYIDRDLKAETNRITAQQNQNNYQIDLKKVGIDSRKADALIAQMAVQNNISQDEMKLKWDEQGRKNRESALAIKTGTATAIQDIALRRAQLTSTSVTNRSAVYKALGEVQSLQAKNSPAAMYLDLIKMDADIAVASQRASAKVAANPAGEFAHVEDGTPSPTEIEAANAYRKKAWSAFQSQNGNAPFQMKLQNGTVITIDPTKDMLENKAEIARASGIQDNYIRQDSALLDDAIRLFNLTPDSSTITLPEGLRNFYAYLDSRGEPLKEMADTDFFAFIKRNGWNGRDPKGLYADYKNRLVLQRKRMEQNGI